MQLNINTDAVVKFTNKLEKLHKSALPVAIRGALNKAAFNVKQETLLKSADKEFIKRQPNFFKANSRVEMAQGFNLSQMKATVGMVSNGLKGGNNYAVKDLEQQEDGGTIKGKSFIPVSKARLGGSKSKAVRPINRLSNIKRIIDSRKSKGKTNKQKFVRAVREAGPGGYVLGNKSKSILWRVDSLVKGKMKITPLYSYKENRSVKVLGKDFMKKASLKSASNIEHYFIEEANRQIQKYK